MSQIAESKVDSSVDSQAHWHIFDILLDQGERGCTYALAERDGQRSIVFRWNDGGEHPIDGIEGEQSSGWIKLDNSFQTAAIIQLFSIERQVQARDLLRMIPEVDDAWSFEHVSLSVDCSFVILRGPSRNARIIGHVDCNALRDVTNSMYMSGYDCRILAGRNKALLAELARTLLAERRCKVRKDGSVIIDIGPDALKSVADRFINLADDPAPAAGAA